MEISNYERVQICIVGWLSFLCYRGFPGSIFPDSIKISCLVHHLLHIYPTFLPIDFSNIMLMLFIRSGKWDSVCVRLLN